MAKIRIGTDIMFRIKITSDSTFPHVFDKSIQNVIPLLLSGGSTHNCSGTHTPTKTATNQCCGSTSPSTKHMLRRSKVQIVDKKELIIDVLFLGEEQRNTGSMHLQLTWIEGDLGSTRNEQLRYTIDLYDVVRMVNSTSMQDLTGVTSEDGRLVITLDWKFNRIITPDEIPGKDVDPEILWDMPFTMWARNMRVVDSASDPYFSIIVDDEIKGKSTDTKPLFKISYITSESKFVFLNNIVGTSWEDIKFADAMTVSFIGGGYAADYFDFYNLRISNLTYKVLFDETEYSYVDNDGEINEDEKDMADLIDMAKNMNNLISNYPSPRDGASVIGDSNAIAPYFEYQLEQTAHYLIKHLNTSYLKVIASFDLILEPLQGSFVTIPCELIHSRDFKLL